MDGNISFLHELVHEGVLENDVFHLGVDVDGERPHVVHHILLEKRSQSGCLCGGMSVRAAADLLRGRPQVKVRCAVPDAKRRAALHALEIDTFVWNVLIEVEKHRVVPRIPH